MLTQSTAAELSALLQSRQVSAQEVTQAYLDRINSHQDEFNAFLTVTDELALQQAEEAQKRLDAGDAPALCGVPYAAKDNLSTDGVSTTCASRILEGYVPVYDATVVAQLKDQGMPLLGKTNMDEFAMGTSNENSAFGPVRNPWDTDRVPGGSSGGSATTVSAELAPLSLGSDTGGSIRQPAALCGIVGFKPTYGRVSRYGLVAFASSLDQIGPFGKSVEDVALFAEALCKHDHRDSTSLTDAALNIADLKSGSIKGLKIALPRELFSDACEPGVLESVEIALDRLRREGAQVNMVDLPSINYGVSTYYIIAPAEASSNLARFDGVRFGQQREGADHIEAFSKTRGELFGKEVKLRILTGTYALSAGYYDAYYVRAQQVRGMMADEFDKVYQQYDLVACPTSPSVAFPLGGVLDQMALKMLDLCTIPANMGGFPSISVPCGLSDDLPVGLLLNGPIMGDEALLKHAYTIEQALGNAYRRPPVL